MGHIIKQKLLIGSGNNSIETELGHDFSFWFDMDEVVGALSFNLPYVKFAEANSDVDLTNLKKGDTAKLYYGDFDEDPGIIGISSLNLVFDGVVDSIRLVKQKGNYSYTVQCIGSLGIANDRKLERKTNEINGPTPLVNTLLQLSGLQEGEIATANSIEAINIFPQDKVRSWDTDSNSLFIKSTGGDSLMEELKAIRKNYALIIHQSGDGYINVITPTQLLSKPDGLSLNAWEFRLNENIWELNYGDLTSDINSVICIGRPPVVGYAVDPIAVQLLAGSNTPGPEHYRYISIERRDIISEEDAETVAKNTLLEIMRNHTIQFKTLFNSNFMVGQPVVVYDNDKFPDGRIFFIKRFEVTISKSDVSCDIIAYANSLTVLPEELVIDSTGIADVDVLDVQYDIENAIGWGQGGFA
jgi:hypothetical protein